MRENLRRLSSMLEDVRGVLRWRGLHSKRVGVRNHGFFPRRTETSLATYNFPRQLHSQLTTSLPIFGDTCTRCDESWLEQQ